MVTDEAGARVQRNVHSCMLVDKSLTQPIIDDVDFVLVLTLAHREVSWLDVAMQVLPVVHKAEDLKDLNSNREH